MATPQEPKGLQQQQKVNVMMSMDLLSHSLPTFGADSDEGIAIMKALQTLSKAFGKSQDKSRELVPAEVLQMLSSLPQAGGASPGARQMASTPPPGMGSPAPM